MPRIRKGVVPAAGLGTILRSMKEGTPKEMLPLGGCPMINYAMREAALSGLKHLYIVINKRKLSLRRYLESDKMEIDLQREISADRIPVPRITFIDQPEPFGSGEAIYRAKVMIGEEPFALMTPDFFLFGSSPALRQVMPLYERFEQDIVGVVSVGKTEAGLS